MALVMKIRRLNLVDKVRFIARFLGEILIKCVRSDYDERSLNAQAAREISKQLDDKSPLVPPSAPFANRRSVSPRPSVMTDSPKMSYIRGKDSLSSPASSTGRSSPQLLDPYSARNEGGSPILPIKPSASSLRVVNRTPDPYGSPEYLKNASEQTPSSPGGASVVPGNKTISAAAFRRPMRIAQPSSPNLNDDGVADTSPLNLRKRNLPVLPPGAGGPRTQPLGGGGVYRLQSAPTSQGQVPHTGTDERSRAFSPSRGASRDEGVLNDDFDYISAYISDDSNAPPVGSYGPGRFATNLNANEQYR
jgi:hypothetical protein